MRKNIIKLLIIGLAVFGMAAFFPVNASAGEIDVYLEGAYDDTYLDVYIYADVNITTAAVISYGVRLEYQTSELTFESAAKNVEPTPRPFTYTSNPTKWQLGNGANQDNPDPAHSAGVVVFKGGILDEAAPTAGVTELVRVFLGTVRFTPAGASFPANPTLTLTYAEDYSADPNSYKNFVAYIDGASPSGEVIDSADDSGVNFRAVNYTTAPFDIAPRGDANGDGSFNVQDYLRVKSFFNTEDFPPYADCNGSGDLNVQDYLCIKSKM